MTRDEEIYSAEFASNPYFMSTDGPQVVGAHQLGFKHGVEWANQHPSDETIMLILNCMGYECVGWRGLFRNSYSLYRAAAPTLFQARLWLGLLKVRNTLKRLKR